MDIHGSAVPMATPSERSGEIRTDELAEFTDYLISEGSDALMPLGTTGEFPNYSREQRATAIRVVADTASVPVLAGCGGTNVPDVVQYVDDAVDAGADVAAVVTPYYHRAPSSGLREFFEAVADEASIPILLYHIPQVTGQDLPPETVATLADHENIVGIKDSSGDFAYHYQLIEQTPDSFDVIQGCTDHNPLSLGAGGAGMISATSNVFPGVMREIYAAHEAGDADRVLELTLGVVTPFRLCFSEVSVPAAIKYCVGLRGIDVGQPVAPLETLSSSEERMLEETFEAVNANAERLLD